MATTDSPERARPSRQRPTAPTGPEAERHQAWELVEQGRYRPLRTRGSFPGRELG
jgi:hypothetical protein